MAFQLHRLEFTFGMVFAMGADDPSGHDDFPSSTFAFVLRRSLDRSAN
jgi:hypothetical protein